MTENVSESTLIKEDEKQEKTESFKVIAFGRNVGLLELKIDHERRQSLLDEGVRLVLSSSSSTVDDVTPNQKKIHKGYNAAQQKREKRFQTQSAKSNKNFKR